MLTPLMVGRRKPDYGALQTMGTLHPCLPVLAMDPEGSLIWGGGRQVSDSILQS